MCASSPRPSRLDKKVSNETIRGMCMSSLDCTAPLHGCGGVHPGEDQMRLRSCLSGTYLCAFGDTTRQSQHRLRGASSPDGLIPENGHALERKEANISTERGCSTPIGL